MLIKVGNDTFLDPTKVCGIVVLSEGKDYSNLVAMMDSGETIKFSTQDSPAEVIIRIGNRSK